MTAKCAFGDGRRLTSLTPEQEAILGAVFHKLCISVNGELVNNAVPPLQGKLKIPLDFTGRGPHDFYPNSAILRRSEGTIRVMFVEEPDGRVSWAYVLVPCSDQELNNAAVAWIRSITFKSPATLDSMPVRIFSLMNVHFRLGA